MKTQLRWSAIPSGATILATALCCFGCIGEVEEETNTEETARGLEASVSEDYNRWLESGGVCAVHVDCVTVSESNCLPGYVPYAYVWRETYDPETGGVISQECNCVCVGEKSIQQLP